MKRNYEDVCNDDRFFEAEPRDLRRTAEDFTEIIGRSLHYFENVDKVDLSNCTAKEVLDLQEGWLYRYQNELLFHNKVEAIVARLIQSL